MNSISEKEQSFYDILDVSSTADISEIKKAYKKMVKYYHPDISKEEDSSEKFKLIVKAYTILRDPVLRKEYDQELCKISKGFLHKNFKYSYRIFLKQKNNLLNSIKLFFKNVHDNKKSVKYQESSLFNDDEYTVPDSILNMSAAELEERLVYSENDYVRINAAIALGVKQEKASYPVLETMVMTVNNQIKKAIIWAIGNIKLNKSVQLLKILYNSASSSLRFDILKAIYKISEGKGKTVNEIFILALNDPNEQLREEALKIFLLTNKKINYESIKGLFNNITYKIQGYVDQLIEQKRIVNFDRGKS